MRGLTGLTKFFIGVVFLSYLGSEVAPAEVTRLPDDARAALQKTHDFTIIKKVSQIPSAGLTAFHSGQDDHDYKMADPKEPFQVTDVVASKSLPLRQLQFAAVSKDYLLIHHARGGYALGYYYVLLKKTGETFTVVWVGEGVKYSSFSRFVKGLKTKSIDDRPGYAY